MKQYLTILNRDFPIRNSNEQKQAFRNFVKEQFPSAREETLEKHTNIIIGDPGKARAIFCAHYDTPRHSVVPNLMLPVNTLPRILYRVAVMLPIFILAAALGFCAGFMARKLGDNMAYRFLCMLPFLAIYFAVSSLVFRGPVNKHNFNDNTSGTAAVLELAARLAEKGDSRFAFILFDDEEKGKLGSKAFAAAYPEIKRSTPVLNMDCVGNGGEFILGVTESFRNDPLYPAFEKAMKEAALPMNIYDMSKVSMNSDHKNFGCAAGICACIKSKRGIYYTPRIHTEKDTVAEESNIAALADAMTAMTGGA